MLTNFTSNILTNQWSLRYAWACSLHSDFVQRLPSTTLLHLSQGFLKGLLVLFPKTVFRKISMSLVTFRLWFRVIQLFSDDLDLVYYLTFEWRWRSWTLYYVQELTFTSRKILFYALHSKWLDIIYSNAAHPILCEGWYFTYMWKTLNWPHHVTKIGR